MNKVDQMFEYLKNEVAHQRKYKPMPGGPSRSKLIVLTMTNCGYCKALKPELEKLGRDGDAYIQIQDPMHNPQMVATLFPTLEKSQPYGLQYETLLKQNAFPKIFKINGTQTATTGIPVFQVAWFSNNTSRTAENFKKFLQDENAYDQT